MTTPKYKINMNHLETRRGIEKLQRDGFTREQISKSMYKATEGMKQADRAELMSKLYDRSE